MFKTFLLFFTITFFSPGAHAGEEDARCFHSVGQKKFISLEFTFPGDAEKYGYVKYKNGSGTIKVERVSEKELARAPNGRPSLIKSEWKEIINGQSAGKYIVVSQGAVVQEFKYIRKKDGKIFSFEEFLDPEVEYGCSWNHKSDKN